MTLTISNIRNACDFEFGGFEDNGRRLIIGRGFDMLVAEIIEQTDLRDKAKLVKLCGEQWLRQAFPVYEQVETSKGTIIVLAGFNVDAAADWIIDQCFLAASHVPPSQAPKWAP